MPENEFDKKVSSELQQLRFKPSDTVWLKVEERIKKKKRRRVIIILFLLAGIALLGYWQWDNFFGKGKERIVKTETPSQEKNNPANEQNAENENNIDNNTQEVKTSNENEKIEDKVLQPDNSTDKTAVDVPGNKISEQNIIDKKKNNRSVVPDKRKPGNNKRVFKPDQKNVVVLSEADLDILTMDDTKAVKDTLAVKYVDSDNVNVDTNQNFDLPNNKIDSVKLDTLVKKVDIKKDSLAKKIDSVSKAVAVDSPVVNIPKKPLNKKWSFGIEFIPGKSSLKEDFFSFSMNKSADAYASPGSGTGSGVPAGPVKSNSAFAFQFGGFFKKQFTKRSSLSIGLRWAYYTEDIRIGARMVPASSSPAFSQLLDALGVNSAYGANGAIFYQVNKYHFFELPVNYIVQLNKSDAHPITLNAGLKIGRMFTSDALVYDTAAGGIYYSSRKHFNKTQYGISISLNWKVTKKDKFYLAIGPVLDMHLNSLPDNPFDKKKYLLFGGLRTSVIFNSKK